MTLFLVHSPGDLIASYLGLGIGGHVDPVIMFHAVMGTALVASGSAVFNQVYERDVGALMACTRLRPLPDGRLTHPCGQSSSA